MACDASVGVDVCQLSMIRGWRMTEGRVQRVNVWVAYGCGAPVARVPVAVGMCALRCWTFLFVPVCIMYYVFMYHTQAEFPCCYMRTIKLLVSCILYQVQYNKAL